MNLVFCFVSFVSAFLLFQVQPVISKFILPWFGGSPGVWTTCMLFFQLLLFGGYSYAHLLARWRPRTQAWVHASALLLAALCLPIAPGESWKPSGDEEPVGRILLLLLRAVGLPYLVLAATSPLVQVWFSHCYPRRTPWRLYSLSNIGSLTALLSYPVLIETRWDVMTQTTIWSGAFLVFAVLMGACAFANRAADNEPTPEGDIHPRAPVHEGRPAWMRRLLWVLLPGFASMMLLGTTNHVCQDVAVIPFLWVVPLSLYLVSFIICFDHPRWYRRAFWALPAMALLFLASGLFELPWPHEWHPGFFVELVVLFGAMFGVCMVCHGELADLKPGTKYLTEYYLLMSAGGALGGLIVSVLAPSIFHTFFEWSLGLLIGFALVSWVAYRGLFGGLDGKKRWAAGAGWFVLAATGFALMVSWEWRDESRLERRRDFYGVLSVSEYADEDTGEVFRSFISGGVTHGRQSLAPERRRDPLTYYGHDTGAGRVLDSLKAKPNARVAIIGMGAGTAACYAEPGQTYRFYEINPNAVALALRWFTFIPDLEARGAKYELELGDARLSLEREPAQHFDAMLLDAFTGDSVPVHLLTREAFELFNRHLKPDGIIAVHITNHFLNLAPVVQRVAAEFGFRSVRIATPGASGSGRYPTDYLLLTRDEDFIRLHPPAPPASAMDLDLPVWTDRRHNLFQILQNR
jgi:hypothetical protein